MAYFNTAVVAALILANVAAAGMSASSEKDMGMNFTKQDYIDQKAAEAAEKAAAKAKEAKMAAFNKVVTMLEDLTAQVLAEGEKEAATYNKFACFCKDTTAEKVAAIEKGKDDRTSLEIKVAMATLKRFDLDDLIAKLIKDIEIAEKEMAVAEHTRAEELKVYETNAADLKAALYALENAIGTLKASKAPSLLQVQSLGKTLRSALLLADALGLSSVATKRTSMVFLQQNPDVPMEDYKFHSDDIIATLEKLLDDFRAEKVEIDEEEVKAVAAHEAYMQEKTDFVKITNKNLDDAKKAREEKNEEIAAASEELSTVSATLLDDQQYLAELSEMCHNKAVTWDQRSRVRADELSTLKAVMDIVESTIKNTTSAATLRFVQEGAGMHIVEAVASDKDAMSAIEAAAEEADAGAAPIGFLQQRLRSVVAEKHGFLAAKPVENDQDGRQAVAMMLQREGEKLKSTLLTSVASRVTADPFLKIKKLIQELIERLLQEAANESNQKGWCDKATADATQKRTYAAEAIDTANSQMAELEALRDKLAEEIDVLAKEIAGLIGMRDEAEAERAEEKAENKATVMEAEEGLGAVNMVIDILNKFYKTVAKETVFSLAQRGPYEDAPEQSFKIGDAYKGAQSTATGIIGMFEVMKADFERTIAETEYAEEQAEQDHLKFMTETGKSLVSKKMAKSEKEQYKANAIEKLNKATEDLDTQTEILITSINELLELKPVCIDTGMSYDERVARRDEEIAALNKALCILKAYQAYGPGGAGSESC
jgi:hypothetical protein